MGVKGHKHEWYAISFDLHTNKPILWACAVEWGCIATELTQLKGRGKNRALVEPQPQVPTPTRGLWAIVEENQLGTHKKARRVGASVPRRPVPQRPSREGEPRRPRHQAEAGNAQRGTPSNSPRTGRPAAGVPERVEQQLPTLHPQRG